MKCIKLIIYYITDFSHLKFSHISAYICKLTLFTAYVLSNTQCQSSISIHVKTISQVIALFWHEYNFQSIKIIKFYLIFVDMKTQSVHTNEVLKQNIPMTVQSLELQFISFPPSLQHNHQCLWYLCEKIRTVNSKKLFFTNVLILHVGHSIMFIKKTNSDNFLNQLLVKLMT